MRRVWVCASVCARMRVCVRGRYRPLGVVGKFQRLGAGGHARRAAEPRRVLSFLGVFRKEPLAVGPRGAGPLPRGSAVPARERAAGWGWDAAHPGGGAGCPAAGAPGSGQVGAPGGRAARRAWSGLWSELEVWGGGMSPFVGREGRQCFLLVCLREAPVECPLVGGAAGLGRDGEGPGAAPQGGIAAAEVQFQVPAGRGARTPAAASVRWPRAARLAGAGPQPPPSAVLGVRAAQGASGLAWATSSFPEAACCGVPEGRAPFPASRAGRAGRAKGSSGAGL